MRSRKQLIAVGFVIAVFLIVWGFNRHNPPKPAVSPRVAVTATETAPVDSPTATPTVDPVAVAAASAVTAWQTQDVATRNALLSPLTTPDYYALIQYADSTLIPTSPVNTSTTVLDADGTAAVTVTLTDGTKLTVTLQNPTLAGAWLTSDIEPA